VTLGGDLQDSGVTVNDFNKPKVYTVLSEDGLGKNYVVKIINPSKAITSFAFANPSATGIIDEANHTITVTLPNGTNLTALVPTITHTGASISPASGVAQDFTGTVTYTVTAEDSSMQYYTVTVILNRNPIAYICADLITGIAPVSLTFNGLKSSDPDNDSLTYSWNFGDGQSGSGSTIQHEFINPGLFNIVLTVNDGNGGIDFTSKIVQIFEYVGINPGGPYILSFQDTLKLDGSHVTGITIVGWDLDNNGTVDFTDEVSLVPWVSIAPLNLLINQPFLIYLKGLSITGDPISAPAQLTIYNYRPVACYSHEPNSHTLHVNEV
jgi:hypothetical protein